MTTLGALTVPFDTSVTQLGQGFDSVNRLVKGTVLQVPQGEQVRFDKTKLAPTDKTSPSSNPSPQTGVNFSMKYAETTTQLRDLLNISGSAQLTKGTVSGSISGAFTKKKVTDRNKIYVIVTLSVTHSVYSIDPRRVSIDSAYVPGTEGSTMKTSDFVSAFGDHFVQAVVIGGSMSAMLEITKNKEDNLNQIKADGSLTVKSAFEVSGEVAFERTVSKLTQGRQTDITLVSVGGNVQTTPSTTQELIRLARRFPLMVLGGSGNFIGTVPSKDPTEQAEDEERLETFDGNAVPVKLVTMPYASLPQWTSSARLQDELAGYIIDDAVEVFEEIDSAKNAVSSMISEFEGNNLSLSDLTKLVDIERNLRSEQVKLLKLLAPDESDSDETDGDGNQALVARGIEKAKEAAAALKGITPAASYLAQANAVLRAASLRYAYEGKKGDPLNPDDYLLLSEGNKLVTGDIIRLRSLDKGYFEFYDVAIYGDYKPVDEKEKIKKDCLPVDEFAEEIRNRVMKKKANNQTLPDPLTEEKKKELLGVDYGKTDTEIAVKYSTLKQQSEYWIPADSEDVAKVESALRKTSEEGRPMLLHLTTVVASGKTRKAAFIQVLDDLGQSEGFLRAVWPYDGGGIIILQTGKNFDEVQSGARKTSDEGQSGAETTSDAVQEKEKRDTSYLFYLSEASATDGSENGVTKWEDGTPFVEESSADDDSGSQTRAGFLPKAITMTSVASGLQVYMRADDNAPENVLLVVRDKKPATANSNVFAVELPIFENIIEDNGEDGNGNDGNNGNGNNGGNDNGDS